jgi:hypothetical protein
MDVQNVTGDRGPGAKSSELERSGAFYQADRTSTVLQRCTAFSTQCAQQHQDCYSCSATGFMCARRPRGDLGVGAHERYKDEQIDPEPRRAS